MITDGGGPKTAVDPTVTDEPNELSTGSITPGVVPVLVPTYRYTSTEFAEREKERLWPRVWQLACSVDHVEGPGDFYEYRAGWLSALIVRGEDGVLRGFQNACRHRGNSLRQGTGTGLTALRCPFHHWTWDLSGRLRAVPDRRGFGPGLANEDFCLLPVQVDTWGPMVFVNFDLEGPALAQFLEGIPQDSAWAELDGFHCVAVTHTPVESNWKVVTEGFSETYHVQGIHPEMLGSIDDVHAPQRLWGLHSASYQNYGVASPRIHDSTDQSVWESFVVTQGNRMGRDMTEPGLAPEVPAGQTMADVIADRIRSHQADAGVDIARFGTDQILRLSQYNLFPNATVLVWGADMLNVLQARPGATPDLAELVMFLYYRRPQGAPSARPMDMDVDDDATLGLVIGQDLGILRTAQRGLHQPGLRHLAVGAEECRIINAHRALERFLGIEPSELLPIGASLPE
jgi:phenylpropionate dioxygenase-like ring-hydroxylating dioxygenase large terminal subunit